MNSHSLPRKWLWLLPLAGAISLSALLLVVPRVPSSPHHTSSVPRPANHSATTRSTEKTTSARTPSVNPTATEETLELVRQIKTALKTDEQKALRQLTDINPFNYEPDLLIAALVDFYAPRADLFNSINALEILRGSAADFLFTETVSELIGDYASQEDPNQLIAFLEAPENRAITLNSSPEAGGQIMQGKDDRPNIIKRIQAEPEPLLRQTLLNGALEKWAVEDLSGLLEYLSSVPAQKELDTGYEKAAFQLRQFSPDLAVAFAMRIRNETLRNDSVSYAAIRLQKENPKLFNQWLTGLGNNSMADAVRLKMHEFHTAEGMKN